MYSIPFYHVRFHYNLTATYYKRLSICILEGRLHDRLIKIKLVWCFLISNHQINEQLNVWLYQGYKPMMQFNSKANHIPTKQLSFRGQNLHCDAISKSWELPGGGPAEECPQVIIRTETR